MFVILLSAFFGILGSAIAAALIQNKSSYDHNLGFPSMFGGLLATAGICVLLAALPVTSAFLPFIGAGVTLAFGVAGTYIARPMVNDYILRQKREPRS